MKGKGVYQNSTHYVVSGQVISWLLRDIGRVFLGTPPPPPSFVCFVGIPLQCSLFSCVWGRSWGVLETAIPTATDPTPCSKL